MSFCAHLLGKDSPILAENPNGAVGKDTVLFSDSFEELWDGLKDRTRSAPVSVLQSAGGWCGPGDLKRNNVLLPKCRMNTCHSTLWQRKMNAQIPESDKPEKQKEAGVGLRLWRMKM